MTTMVSPISYWLSVVGLIAAISFLLMFLGWLIVNILPHKKKQDPNTCPECGQQLPFPRNTQRPITCLREKK